MPKQAFGVDFMGKLRESLSEMTENCGLPVALEVMGERWSFMILRASFNGLYHFEELLDELGIARNILSNRLTKLVQSGILKRAPCAEDRRRIQYRLTDKGIDLLPTMIALRQWGERWGTGIPSNPVLCDERDRKPIASVALRAHDGRILNAKDLCWIEDNDLDRDDLDQPTADVRQLIGNG